MSLGRALSDEADLASAPTDNLAPRSKQLSEPRNRPVAKRTDRAPPELHVCSTISSRQAEIALISGIGAYEQLSA